MISGLRFLILGAALVLVSCTTTVYSYRTNSSPLETFHTATIHWEDPRESDFASLLATKVPGYEKPTETKPSPEDLVIVFGSLDHKPESTVNALVNTLLEGRNRRYIVQYRATVFFDGQEVGLSVGAQVTDLAEVSKDPKTGRKVVISPFTESTFSQVWAGTNGKDLFRLPATLPDRGTFPFLLFHLPERRVVLTTVETILEDPDRRDTFAHGLWRNLKLPEQRFEIQDATGRLLASFDNASLSWIDDPSVSPGDLKLLAAAVLGFQAMAREYYRSVPLYLN